MALAVREHDILRSFILPDERGGKVELEKFRGQRNLLLLFVRGVDPEAESLLSAVNEAANLLLEEEAAALFVLRGTKKEATALRERLRLTLPVLYDEQGNVVDAYCSHNMSVYVTDRFREIFAFRDGDPFPIKDILLWLAHINHQCPE